MTLNCKHCGEIIYKKAGFSNGKQRYKCKSCNKVFSEGDKRVKYSMEQKLKAIKLYTDGVGLRTIERAEGISTPLLIHWIRTFGKLLKHHLLSSEIPEHTKDIAILEVDELFSFYQKKNRKLTYGLLWTARVIRTVLQSLY